MAPSAISPDRSVSASPENAECHPMANVKTIMVTGGAGFIGSWMVKELNDLYADSYKIVVFDKMSEVSTKNNFAYLEGKSNFAFFQGNLEKWSDVIQCVEDHEVDAIIHFAAISHVDTSFSSPCDFSFSNYIGTHNLLEAARLKDIKRFVHISTDEVYGELVPGHKDHREDDPLCPTNPYSASKAAAEMMVNAYIKSYKLPAVIIRSNNVYGPGQFPEKLIPKFIMLLHHNQKVPMYGHGQYTRRFVYGADVANAVNIVFHKGETGEVYNIGTYDEVSNRVVARKLIRSLQPKTSPDDKDAWIQRVPDRPFHDRAYGVDFTKLTNLGWKQRVSFDQGLDNTLRWYVEHGDSWWPQTESGLQAH